MYNYKREREKLFTDEGQRIFIQIRDHAHDLIETAGAFSMARATGKCAGGDSWMLLACVDRLVELGEIVEVPRADVPGQLRVFVRTGE